MRVLWTASTVLALVACGSSDSPSGPDGNGDGDIMTATTGGTSQWSTFGAAASGSITVTTYTSSRIAGTFQFLGTADPGTDATGTLSVTNGTFDIAY